MSEKDVRSSRSPGGGLVAEIVADVLRLPRMVVLLAAGVLLGPEVLEWIDVPLDSLGPQLLFSLGVSIILFYGGLELSLRVLSRVGVGLGLLAVPGVILTAAVVGAAAALAFDLPFEQAFLIGAVGADRPSILIPLFEGGRRPRSCIVVWKNRPERPTGAVLGWRSRPSSSKARFGRGRTGEFLAISAFDRARPVLALALAALVFRARVGIAASRRR